LHPCRDRVNVVNTVEFEKHRQNPGTG